MNSEECDETIHSNKVQEAPTLDISSVASKLMLNFFLHIAKLGIFWNMAITWPLLDCGCGKGLNFLL